MNKFVIDSYKEKLAAEEGYVLRGAADLRGLAQITLRGHQNARFALDRFEKESAGVRRDRSGGARFDGGAAREADGRSERAACRRRARANAIEFALNVRLQDAGFDCNGLSWRTGIPQAKPADKPWFK